VLEQIRWLMIDKYKCLNDITLEDLREFARQFPKELYIQSLIQGNYTEESAHNVLNTVLSRLNCVTAAVRRWNIQLFATSCLGAIYRYVLCACLSVQNKNKTKRIWGNRR